MCVVFVVSYFILYYLFLSHLSIFWIFQIFKTFFLKSSDLSMVNPHISLNPWNPLIHGAILRFSKDFYCEIHGFCWQSSDLARGFISVKSSGGSEEFIYFVWVSVWCLDRLPFTQSPLTVPLSLCRWCSIESWIFHEHRSDSDYSCLFWIISFDFWSIHLNLIMKSFMVWGEILRFPSKSLGKSSDCADFTKSMDLSDLSENISIFPNFNFQFLSIQLIVIIILNLVNSGFKLNANGRCWISEAKS